MTNREKVDYINTRLDVEDLLLALAEEAAELAQAALKLHRARCGKKTTPVTPDEAILHLSEEMNDTILCWNVLWRHGDEEVVCHWEDFLPPSQQKKLDRWVQRLMEAEGLDNT